MSASIVFIGCDPYLAGIYGRKLQRDDWNVLIAETVKEGEGLIKQHRPDVILLEVDCVVDPIAQIELWQRIPALLKTKFVLLAKEASYEEVQRALRSGIHQYIVFGHFVPQEFLKKMRKLVKA